MASFDRYRRTREAILYTLAYFDAIDYAPTWTECAAWLEWSGAHGFELESPPSGDELVSARNHLIDEQSIESGFGRIALPGRLAHLVTISCERTILWNRKMRRSRRVLRWLLRFRAVRYVAIANTTALAHARHEGDLDFFVIVNRGSLWTTRFLAVGPLRVLGRLVGGRVSDDPPCMSYFITDDALDLASHTLPGDDVYFRYWFLSLLPLYDDGIGKAFWDANGTLRAKHPRAHSWMINPDLFQAPPLLRFPQLAFIESLARSFQLSWFPPRIRLRMNQDTTVMVNDQVLKFHVDDGREAYRATYNERLRAIGLV